MQVSQFYRFINKKKNIKKMSAHRRTPVADSRKECFYQFLVFSAKFGVWIHMRLSYVPLALYLREWSPPIFNKSVVFRVLLALFRRFNGYVFVKSAC